MMEKFNPLHVEGASSGADKDDGWTVVQGKQKQKQSVTTVQVSLPAKGHAMQQRQRTGGIP